jgi:HAD superfamily hydrolase (TIGR01459 family)
VESKAYTRVAQRQRGNALTVTAASGKRVGMSAPRFIGGFSEIAPQYDAVYCDVWGVVHNGCAAFHDAIAAIRRFRAEQGPAVLLSNAPRLPDGVEAQFVRLGIPLDFYDGIVTSGSVARDDLICRIAERGELPLFYLGPARDNPVFHGLNIRLVGEDEAEMVFCTGLLDDETEQPEDYRSLLEGFKSRGLPFLCANPDIVVQRGDRLVYCAGALARLYESMGGETVYYGKPYRVVFERARDIARRSSQVSRPIVIGDGIETDIGGAHRAGLDALFIAGGIHAEDDKQALTALFRQHGVGAVAAMRALRW